MKKQSDNRQKSLAEILKNYYPHPEAKFYTHMKTSPWNKKVLPMQTQTFRFSWQVAIIFALLILAFLFTVPPVRATLSSWLGLSVAPSDQMPSTETNRLIAAPTFESTITQQPESTSESAIVPQNTPVPKPTNPLTDQAGWIILEPTWLPDGYSLESAYYDPTNKMVFATYTATRPLEGSQDTYTESITLVQAHHNDTIPLQIAPSTEIQDVMINNQIGVFALGAWDSEFVPDASEANDGLFQSSWRNDLAIQNLFWQVGDVYLVLITGDTIISQADLIQIAISIQ